MAICVQNAIDIISNLTIDLKFEIVPIEDALSRICAKIFMLQHLYQSLIIQLWMDML